jgi:hypothetical protein
MQRNQHGGCAMMAMGHFSAEVVEMGMVWVDGVGWKLVQETKRLK